MVTITNHTYIITPSSLSFILHCLRFQQSAPLFPILSYSTNISPSSFKSPSFPYSLSEVNREKIRTVRNPYPISQNSFREMGFSTCSDIFFSVYLSCSFSPSFCFIIVLYSLCHQLIYKFLIIQF